MKNLARWLKFLLLVGVLFVPSGCDRWYWWHRGDGHRGDGRGGDDRRGGGDEKSKDRPKEHAEEGHR